VTSPRISEFGALLTGMRLHNGLACALVLLAGRSRLPDIHPGRELALALAIILLSSAAHLINDLADLPADRTNRPGRPLPAGRVTASAVRRAAAWTWGGGLFLGLAGEPSWTGWWLFWGLAGPGYSLLAKGRGWLAPLWTAAVISSCWLAGVHATGLRHGDLLVFGTIYWYLVLREVVKTLADMPGDLRAGQRSFAGRFPGTPRGVLLLVAPLLAGVAWWLKVESWLPARGAALILGACLLGAAAVVLRGLRGDRHLAGSLLKIGAFMGLALLLHGVP